MHEEQRDDAQLKLQAYDAAIRACCAAKSYSSMNMGGGREPTVTEIKSEAERLWAWMTEDKKPA